MSLASSYDPLTFETQWYARWEKAGYFQPSGQGTPYSILLPPPNVTGTLHMGHAFQQTLMDTLIRYHRMRGYDTLWQVGTDHAGIATEMVVTRKLANESPTFNRQTMGREAFIAKVWQWKAESGDIIEQQMRRLGLSADWSRRVFTMDEGPSRAVTEAFIQLYQQGFIYRGQRLVNWDPVLQTAISDLEVENIPEAGFLWSIRYLLADCANCPPGDDTSITVATTRPETLLGDTAIMVHPDDPRYQRLIGRHVLIPLTKRLIPIIADPAVDPAFGTGAVKVTPAHDFNDYQVAVRHGLPLINIFDSQARILTGHAVQTPISGEETHRQSCEWQREPTRMIALPDSLQGLDRFQARQRILADLAAQGLLADTQPHTLQVPRGDRTGQIIEPYLTDQWFVRMASMAQFAMAAVESGQITLVPANWVNTYRHWLNHIQDWCISRQLWWGHRIPAWYDHQNQQIYVGHSEAEIRQRYQLDDQVHLVQDEDVLETWFSSQLWPLSTLGWPDSQTMAQRGYARYLPSQVLITGFDILFFWVARMVIASQQFAGKIPFETVYITGLIRDAHGQKMSKSKGNVLDPLDIIDGITLPALQDKRTHHLLQPKLAQKIRQDTAHEFPNGMMAHGADALRFTLAAVSQGRDIHFDLSRAAGYKNFCNKLWNATRFVLMHTQGQRYQGKPPLTTAAEHWICAQLQHASVNIKTHFTDYRFDLVAQTLYELTWNQLCDWYLEFAKAALAGHDPAATASTRHTLLFVMETALRLLHPLIPFVTEELWQHLAPQLGIQGDSICLQAYPEPQTLKLPISAEAVADIEWLMRVVTALRQIRSELQLRPAQPIVVLYRGAHGSQQQRLNGLAMPLSALVKVQTLAPLAIDQSPPPCATMVVDQVTFFIPLTGLVDLSKERVRLDKQIQRMQAEIAKCEKKLASSAFVNHAPATVVAQERERLSQWQRQLAGLSTQRQHLT